MPDVRRIGVDAAYAGDPRAALAVGRVTAWARQETGGDPQRLTAGRPYLGHAPLPAQCVEQCRPLPLTFRRGQETVHDQRVMQLIGVGGVGMRFQPDALAKNMGLVETLGRLAKEKGRTPAQLALAWLLHQGNDIVPIPGAAKVSRLQENVAAAEVRLTKDDLAAIEAAVPESAVEGRRYDEAGLAMVGL